MFYKFDNILFKSSLILPGVPIIYVFLFVNRSLPTVRNWLHRRKYGPQGDSECFKNQ